GDDPARGARLARGAPPGPPGRAAGASRGRGERRGARPPRPAPGPARRAGAASAREGCVSAGRRARAGARAPRSRRVHHLRVRGAGRGRCDRARGARRAHRGERAVSGLLERRPGLLVLVDPSRTTPAQAADVARAAGAAGAAGIMIGSSFDGTQNTELVARAIRQAAAGLPVALFPGSALQLTAEVDLVLFLSLVSGRNAQYLIEEHVRAVPFLTRHLVATLSTGYILVDGGRVTSVEAVSQTRPLPADKPELAAAHATAARLIGMRAIYLDAGSGAPRPVAADVIRACRAAGRCSSRATAAARRPRSISRPSTSCGISPTGGRCAPWPSRPTARSSRRAPTIWASTKYSRVSSKHWRGPATCSRSTQRAGKAPM